MPDIFASQDVNTIQKRLVDYIKQHGTEESVIEGTFKRDIINSTAEEFKNVYFEMDMLRDSFFASTSWGDYLTEKCKDFGIDRKLAAKAKGVVTVKGNAAAWIPKKSLFQSVTGHKFYTTEESYIEDNGTATIPVEAENAGSEYNIEADMITLIPMSIGGVTSVTNPKPTYDGFDEESDESLYQRYSDYIRTPATSGNIYHYNNWATSVVGVGGCRVTELVDGAGTVGVAIVDSNGDKASNDLIAKVKAYIETVRPAGAKVIVSTPDIITIDIVVTGVEGTGTIDLFKEGLTKYFKKNGFKINKVTQADIVKQLFNAGYTDFSSLSINNKNDSVQLNGKLPKIGSVNINA